jgi:hypothetical protein
MIYFDGYSHTREFTWRIEEAIATTSTGTTEPMRSRVKRGVTITDVIVVKLVNIIPRAISPSLK